MDTMRSDLAQQFVTLLQEVGIVSLEDIETVLTEPQATAVERLRLILAAGVRSLTAQQECVSHVTAPIPRDAAAPLDLESEQEYSQHTLDDYDIDDQHLQAILLQEGRLHQAQLTQAVQAQQETGYSLWRTVINLGFLTPQEMSDIIKIQGHTEPQTSQPLSAQALVPQARPTLSRPVLAVDDSATAVQIVNTIFEGAMQARATDIHIEPQLPRMRVRYRIDGMLFDALTVPQPLETSIISRIKVLADMNITERRLPQDGRLSIRLHDQEYNMRVATIPTAYGEKLVLRLLMKSNVLTGLKQLGLGEDNERRLRRLIARPQGMILVTGPIGSGKTTTLYAALNEVNILTNNIVTIEDPVEYQLAGINQVEVDTKAGLTFATGLRSILRQDADILMVGEIRDIETATVALRAALTGQQLFSTLHTVDAPSAITTLGNFGIQPYLIASALSGVVAQRLVRRICASCRRWYKPSPALVQQLGLQSEARAWEFAYGEGCEACYYTGYLGRTGLFEILRVSETLRSLITEQAGEHAIQTAAVREGMQTLQQNGISKIIQGTTTPQEVMREVYL